jgi:rRNA processing protein Gar1
VLDRTGRPLGRVARVFGPVAQPYLSIRPVRPPTLTEAAAWIGATVLDEGG